MARILTFLVRVPPLLLAILFGLHGVRWLFDPERAAGFWGFDLPAGGLALSSMIAACSSLALTLSACLFIALVRKDPVWYYPPILMFGFMALGRIVAGVAHAAPPLPDRVVPELVFAGLLFLASRHAPRRQR